MYFSQKPPKGYTEISGKKIKKEKDRIQEAKNPTQTFKDKSQYKPQDAKYKEDQRTPFKLKQEVEKVLQSIFKGKLESD